MQRLNILLLASTFALLVLVFGLTHALKQHPPYTPQVNTEQQADSTLKGEENPKTGTQSAAKPNQEHGGKYSEQGENEGTEFWPPFLGIRLKITDSLLALFTAGLLIFTGLLWRSTDKLWAAGERQFRLTRVIPCGNLATRKLPIKLLQGPPTPQLDPLKLRRPLCSSPSDLTYSSRIIEICADSACVAKLPAGPVYRDETKYYTPRLIGADKIATVGYLFKTPIDGKVMTDIAMTPGLVKNARRLFAFGYVKYRDIFDYTHTVGFCWRYNLALMAFIPAEEEEGYTYRISEPPKPA